MNQTEKELLARITALGILVEAQYVNMLASKPEGDAERIIDNLPHLASDLEVGEGSDPKQIEEHAMDVARLIGQELKIFAERLRAKQALLRAKRYKKGQ